MKPDGSCPFCFQTIDYTKARKAAAAAAAESGSGAETEEKPAGEEEDAVVPWHFKALVGLTVVYLGYRFVQGIEWVAHHL